MSKQIHAGNSAFKLINTLISHKILQVFTLLFLLIAGSVNAQPKQELTSSSKKAIKAFEEANVLYNQRRDEDAIKSYKRASEIDPAFVEPLIMIGQIYNEQKKYADALEYNQKAYSVNPTFFPRLLFDIADLEFSLGKYSDAKKHLTSFLADPKITISDKKKASSMLANATFAENAVKHPVPFNPVNLGAGVNSKYAEYGPAVTIDDASLIFTVKAPFNGVPEERLNLHSEDFFLSTFKDGKWEKSTNLGAPINTPGNEGSECISLDGKIMLLTVCEAFGSYPEGRRGMGRCDIFYSQRIGNSWSRPLNMGPAINSSEWDSQPAISPDGKTIYFVSTRAGGKGGFDIWKSTLVNDAWTPAINLGDSINTEGTEFSPFMAADNQTFYFSSNGHLTIGNNDLYVSRKKSDGTFSRPVNLGYPINTSGNEFSMIVNGRGDKAYYSSAMAGGFGDQDLYSFELPPAVRAIPVTYFKGKITDKLTSKPLEARFQLIDLATGLVNTDEYSDRSDGTFMIPLPSGKSFALNVSAKGYLFHSENFDLPKVADIKPYEKDVALSPISEGSTTVLKNVFFETASFALKKESEVELQKLAEFLKLNPNVSGEIAGHTDNVGDRAKNQLLSENRAKAVMNYLVNQGIDATRLTSKGYADTRPIAPNTSDENKALNRRTEFRITKK